MTRLRVRARLHQLLGRLFAPFRRARRIRAAEHAPADAGALALEATVAERIAQRIAPVEDDGALARRIAKLEKRVEEGEAEAERARVKRREELADLLVQLDTMRSNLDVLAKTAQEAHRLAAQGVGEMQKAATRTYGTDSWGPRPRLLASSGTADAFDLARRIDVIERALKAGKFARTGGLGL